MSKPTKINFLFNFKNTFLFFKKHLLKKSIIFISIILISLFSNSPKVLSLSDSTGKELFNNYCSGCHINGGNIIRRGKTLKLSSLKKNRLDDPDLIAKIAREGIGSMSGYKQFLGENGDVLVAKWIWEQAQNAWVQG